MVEASARMQAGAWVRPDPLVVSAGGQGFEGRLLGRLGRFEVRLAADARDVARAQELRYAIFRNEAPTRASNVQPLLRRDEDRFDRHCDHLLLIDRQAGEGRSLIGTYRLLRQDKAALADGFYGQSEFDVAALVARHADRRFLELGRSCVEPRYRGLRTVELLWHAIWAYVLEHRIDVLFGCASLPGVFAPELEAPLAYLRANAMAPAEWRAAPLGPHARPLGSQRVSQGATMLPPLLKGYLRLGGMVSDHAVVDHDFGTTDVLLVLPLERISPRYVAHYGAAAQRFA